MRVTHFLLAGSAAIFLSACSGDDGRNGSNGANGEDGTNGANGVPQLVTLEDVVKTNANIAYAAYSDSLVSAIQLKSTLQNLVDQPSADTFAAAKTSWLASREPYGQSEVYRFRDGPIDALKDDGTLGEDGDGPEGRINAWPLGEAVIDYVANQVDGDENPEDAATTGDITGNIIADSTAVPTIDKEGIKNFFGFDALGGDERNVISGYHAIEFLLWGQDLNADGSGSGERDASAGQRPFSDYLTDGNCTSGDTAAEDVICQRRGDFLIAAADLLIEDLQALVDAWDPSVNENHYADFLAAGEDSLGAILESMGRLSFGELAGERMNIALLQNSQEDEHSCFSDNTHRDIYLNAAGIYNSFHGEYSRLDGSLVQGAGISDYLIAQGEIELENQLRAALEDSMIKVTVIDQKAKAGIPFDMQVQEGIAAPSVSSAIGALSAQTDIIEDVIQALNLSTDDLRQDTEEEI